MSLDVYLTSPEVTKTGSGIYIRENGSVREITRAEWDERFPDREPAIAVADNSHEVYSANITHNLARMADAAGIYMVLWHPGDLDLTKAHQLIAPLRSGLATLVADPAHFEAMNPENGWGSYDQLVTFVRDYLNACEKYPSADVNAWA